MLKEDELEFQGMLPAMENIRAAHHLATRLFQSFNDFLVRFRQAERCLKMFFSQRKEPFVQAVSSTQEKNPTIPSWTNRPVGRSVDPFPRFQVDVWRDKCHYAAGRSSLISILRSP